MTNVLLLLVLIVLIAAVVLLVLLLRRQERGLDLSPLVARLEASDRGQERVERAVREEVARNREEANKQSQSLRQEVGATLTSVGETLAKTMDQLGAAQRSRLEIVSNELTKLTESNRQKLDGLRTAVEQKLTQIQEDNARKLEDMRKTVDEKLQSTLEKRLGESFTLVSDRLEQVRTGLSEVQNIAGSVGDLKKVLTNVKTRGTWGEVQLGNLLEQVLSPDQYAANVATRPESNERVEFAIKLPGRDETDGRTVWLPVDAKFPMEDYQRLIEASERGDGEAVEAAGRQIENLIRAYARDIRDKYLHPPGTTDFGIMFLPSEGLYAEVLRRPGLVELLQRECRVSVAGPTTLAALLNSLQMGFRTLAIQKRSSEVWTILGAVKAEFDKFGDIIGKVQKKLQEASNVIDSAAVRTRAIGRKLRDVQELPAAAARHLLGTTDLETFPADEPDAEPESPEPESPATEPLDPESPG